MALTNDPEGSTITSGETIWKASLPERDFELIHQTNMAALSDMFNWNDTSAFRNDSNLMQTRVASLFLIYTTPIIYNDTWQNGDDTPTVQDLLTGLPEFRHEAMEFIFHLCVQKFDTKVTKGKEQTKLVDTKTEPIGRDSSFELKMNCTSLLGPYSTACPAQKTHWNDTLTLSGSQNINNSVSASQFTANYRGMEEIARGIKMYLPGYGRATFQDAQVHFGGESNFFENFVKDVLFTTQNLKNSTLRTEGIQRFYERIAVYLSLTLREVKADGPQNSFNMSGIAWKEETYVQVKWGWITFLALEIFAAAIFLAVTIIAEISGSRGSDSVLPGLKDSALAHLVALSIECRAALGGELQQIDELKDKAVKLKVRFSGNQVVPST
ncbi:hypothetical protein N0V90_010702 [Kalmusia sp. IMI 367209]|nr:hypothetical protein N0V90_010702 [Kalmusia sp. IMI 367209]